MYLVIALVMSMNMPALPDVSGASKVVTAGSCNYCGCRGGPGWRIKKTGQCASKKSLAKQCGSPPSERLCTKES